MAYDTHKNVVPEIAYPSLFTDLHGCFGEVIHSFYSIIVFEIYGPALLDLYSYRPAWTI